MTVHQGQLGIELFDDEFIQNPYPLYRRMLATGPVHRIADSGFYAVCSWAAVSEAVAKPDVFSSNLTATMVYQPGGTVTGFAIDEIGGPTQALATADDPAHAVHRKLVVAQLAAKRIRELEPVIIDAADRLWDHAVHDGTIEWMAGVANRLPMLIVSRLIGVPDDDVDQLMRWAYSSTQLIDGLVDADQLAAARTAATELAGYINDKFTHAAAAPRNNLLGDLATACASTELDSVTAQVMMITLFSAGGESTASLLGSAAHILAIRPDIQRQVRDDPRLLGAFLEEVLRCESPFRGHYRHVVDDTVLCGENLVAGSRLLLLWAAANRDPAHFPDPNQFRLDRSGGKGHISFGKGAHFCVGAALARLEARIVLGRLLDCSSWIHADEVGRWLPSLSVRRLEKLVLRIS